jgi:hypothetical protein
MLCAAALASLVSLLAAGCGRQAAAPAAGSGRAAAAAPDGSQGSAAHPEGRGLPTPPFAGSGAAPILGQPQTSELRSPPQSVIVDQPPPPPPAPLPAPDRGGLERALAARERRLAERQAALDARERRLSRQGLPPAGGATVPAPGGPVTANGASAPAGAGSAEQSPSGENETASADGAAGAPGTAGAPGRAGAPDEPGPEPAPLPAAESRERQLAAPLAVPAGTAFEVEFTRGLASNASSVGETFRARVLSDLRVDGGIAVPAGSEVLGVVTEAVAARRIGGQAKLSVKFTDLVLPSGSTVPLHASFLEQGPSRAGRDAATIGGSTAGGALLGRILGSGSRGRGTIIGALVGAAVGTAIASKTAGEEVVIPEGSVVSLKLDEALEVRPRR